MEHNRYKILLTQNGTVLTLVLTIKNANRANFGIRLPYKTIEFVPDKNIVRIPILNTKTIWSFNYFRDFRTPWTSYCYDKNTEMSFNPPLQSFFCERLPKDGTLRQIENNLDNLKSCNRIMDYLTIESVCDGYQDCKNNDDEDADFCKQFNCPANKWKCHKGPSFQCIHVESVCDNILHCENGEDEIDCEDQTTGKVGEISLLAQSRSEFEKTIVFQSFGFFWFS